MNNTAKIICFGDSNTYGYDAKSMLGDCFDEELKWTHILAETLGVTVINAGVNGRSIPHGMVATLEISALKKKAPADLVIVMLGSNDILNEWYDSAEQLSEAMGEFLRGIQLTLPGVKLLLVAPPRIDLTERMARQSARLPKCYEETAKVLGISFADASKWPLPLDWDGVHFTEEAHRIFAAEIAEEVKTILRA